MKNKNFIKSFFNFIITAMVLSSILIANFFHMINVQALEETKIFNYTYTGDYQIFTAPNDGVYRVSLWGASGGDYTKQGGYGAYTDGYITLKKGETFYVYVGQSGDGVSTPTFNGGGSSAAANSRSGGGATDIRLVAGSWNNFDSLKSRIMVAGGGGGASGWSTAIIGGNAGALTGYNGNFYRASGSSAYTVSTGGTQTKGGNAGTGAAAGTPGLFGIGGNGQVSYGGGGGAGYYGGGGASYNSNVVGTGAGGSSYISGHLGNDAINETSIVNNITHSGNPDHYSGFVFFNSRMIDGSGNILSAGKTVPSKMPNPNGTFNNTGIGNDGNGYARIEYVVDGGSIDYTPDFAIGTIYRYDTVTTHLFVAPADGIYKIELWGARGGYGKQNNSNVHLYGRGAYTGGLIRLKKGETFYIYVGGAGGHGTGCNGGTPGWNGGGTGGKDSNCDSQPDAGGGGGGATDVRLVSGEWNDFNSLKSRIMVAAGGGGSNYSGVGGAGGVFSGLAGVNNTAVGTQTSGHAFGYSGVGGACTDGGGGGGSGYYAGTSGTTCNRGGGGGSSYVSTYQVAGYTEMFNAVGVNATASNRMHTNQPIHYSGYTFESVYAYAGNQSMPNTAGTGNMTGNDGNGYAKVTIIDVDSRTAQLDSLTLSKGSLDKSFNSNTYEYNVILNSEDYNVTIDATTLNSNDIIVSGVGDFTFKPGTTTHEIILISSTGDINIYKLNVTRPASTYKYLNDIKINGNSITNFNPTTLTYEVPLSFDDEEINIGVTLGRPGQTVTGIGEMEVSFGNTLHEIYVTSEDGLSTIVYKMEFKKENSSKLKILKIGDYRLTPDFNSDITTYELNIPSNVLSLNVEAIPYDKSAKVTITGAGYIKNDKTVIKITVTQEDIGTTVYIVNAIKEGAVDKTVYEYSCKKVAEQFIAPATGIYKIELWGGGGGYGRTHWALKNRGGYGAYTSGEILLNKDEIFYVYVGCAGGNSGLVSRYAGGTAGFNGGAVGGNDSNQDSQPEPGGGGGGATDIRLTSGAWNDFNSLKSRIMIAAGGGGGNFSGVGGAGGTLNGIRGINNTINSTQTSGYAFGYGMPGGACTDGSGGAGGGYYGGYTGTGCNQGGGGGSSFVSGCEECNAVSGDSLPSSIIPTNQPIHYSGYSFQNISMINGNSSMPNTTTGYITGKSGDGYAKITLLAMPSQNNFLSRIEVSKGAISPVFDMGTYEYNLNLNVNDTKLSITAIPEDKTATVSGNGNYNIPAGTTKISINVTAENGDVRVYTVNVNRPASNESKPDNIVVSGLVPSLCAINESYCKLSSEFNPNTHTYYMTVPSRIKDLEFTVVKSHDYQQVVGEGVFNLIGGENTITIEITSEDETNRDVYVYYIVRDMTGNTDLDTLVIDDPEREINFDPGITEYFIAIPNEYTSVGLTAIASDDRVIPVITGNENFVVGLNMIEIYMKAVNGEEKTYIINVYREQSGNTFLSNLEVKNGETTYPLTPVFNKILNVFTVTVPNNISTVEIIGNVEVPTTSVIGLGSKNLLTGTNKFKIITTAEDGSSGNYDLTIIREKSTNADLESLSVSEGTLNPVFESGVTTYNTTVNPNIKSMTINAKTVSDKATYVISGNSNFKAGNNVVKITVTAEAGNKKEYILNVNRLVSTNNYLSSLNTNAFDMTSIFNKEVLEYNIDVDNSVSVIDITATKEDPLATVKGTGKYNLKTGLNTITIDVTSESKEVRSYVINIRRAYNTNADLKSIANDKGAVFSPSFNGSITEYVLNVQNEVTNIKITGTVEVSTSIVTGNGTYNLVTGDNIIKLTVTSESGLIKVYTVKVVRDKSINDDLSYLFIHEGAIIPNFNETVIEYQVKVGHNVNRLTIDAIPEDPNATYQIIGNNNLQSGHNTVIVRVTAEAGETYTKDYVIDVIKQEQNQNSNRLTNLTVNRGILTPIFNKDNLVYRIEVEYQYTNITVNGTKEDNNAIVTGFGTYNLSIGPNIIPVKVMSSDGIERDYQVIVTRKKSDDARLSKLTVFSSTLLPNFSSNTYAYSLSTSNEKLDIDIKTVEQEATYEIIGNNELSIGTNIVIIRVTAPDKVTTKDYALTVTRDLSNNNNLSSLTVFGTTLDPVFNKTTTLYKAKVGNDINTIIIEGIAEDPTATVDNIGEITLDVGENIVEITVTSASGKVKIYTVIIEKEGSGNNKLSSLTIDNGVLVPEFDPNVLVYNVQLPYENDKININATALDSNAFVKGDEIHNLNVGNNVINISVTAENGNINTYTININRENIISSKLKSIDINPYQLDTTFNSDLLNYIVNVDYEITTLNFNIETLDPNATYKIIGNSNFTVGMNTVEIEVISSNGIDVTTYTLDINRQSQSNTYLAYISTSKGVLTPIFDKTNLSYTVLVDETVDSVVIGAEADVASSIVTGTGTYPLNPGDNFINLIVTSNTGIKRTYIINVIRAKSNDNLLKALVVRKGSVIYGMVPGFNSLINNYNVEVPEGTDTIELYAIGHENAIITGIGTKELIAGDNHFQIEVTSQSGLVNIYNITVKRKLSTNNFLTDIVPSIGILEPDFSYFGTEYTLRVDSGTSLLSFEVYKEDRYAKVTGQERQTIPDGTSIRTITVTSEDGSTREYHITVIKDRTDEARLSSLSLKGYTFNEPFNPNVYQYTVTVPNDKKTILPTDVIATSIDSNAVIVKDDILSLSTANDNIYNINVSAVDGFTKETYQIIIKREKGKVATLASLLFNVGTLDKSFNPNINEYTLKISNNITEITPGMVTALPTDSNAKLEKTEILDMTVVGDKYYYITVTSDDGSVTNTYRIKVEYLLSNNTKLSSLTVSEGNLNPVFNPNIREYTLNLLNTVSDISIDGETVEESATIISGLGTHQILDNEVVIEIKVMAEDGTIGTYKISVRKNLTVELNLEDIFINDYDDSYCAFGQCIFFPIFNEEVVNYTITLPNEIDKVDINAIKKNESQIVKFYNAVTNAVINPDNYKLNIGKNNIRIEVTNSLSEVKNYFVSIDRLPSSNNYLSSLSVTSPNINIGFEKKIQEYFIEVDHDVESIEVNAISEHPNATIKIKNNYYLKDGNNDVIIEVTAPNGVTRDYIIHVLRKSLYNNYLRSITVSSGKIYNLTPTFNKTITSYTTTVDSNVTKITLDAVADVITTTVEGTGEKQLVTGNNVFKIISTANTGEVAIYTVNVIREKATNVYLKSLTINEGTLNEPFNRNLNSYTMDVTEYVNNLTINALPEDSNSIVQITGNTNLKTGKNIVNIVVVSQDRTTSRTYRIVVNKAQSSNYLLKSLTVSDGGLTPEFNPTDFTYAVVVPHDISSANVNALPYSDNAYVSGNGTYALQYGKNKITVMVTAEDGTNGSYVIEVYRQYNNNLISIVTDRGDITPVFDKNTTEYSLLLKNEITNITVIGLKEDSNAKVTGNGTYSLSAGDNYIYLTVSSIDASEKIYTLKVIREASNNNYLKSLNIKEGILNGSFDKKVTDYEIMISNEYGNATIEVLPEDFKATYEIIGNNNLVLGSNHVIVRVKAENGETRDYNINIIKQPAELFSNRLISLTVSQGMLTPSFNPSITSYAVTVNNDVSSIVVNAIRESVDAKVNGIGTHKLEYGRNRIAVTVTSKDGIVRTYEIIVNRVLSSDARLLMLSFSEGSLSPVFNQNNNNYTISVPSNIYRLTPTVVPIVSGTSYEIIGNDNLKMGENNVIIRTTSPDGTNSIDYNIKVIKGASTNNKLLSLTSSSGEIIPLFSKDNTGPYHIDVPNSINTIVLTGTTEDDKSIVSGLGLHQLDNGSNYIPIVVTAENGSVRTYILIINREPNQDVKLISLSVSDGTLTPNFNSNVFMYNVEVPYDIDSINVSAVPSRPELTVTGNYERNLTVGNNIISVTVSDQSGSITTYTINVERQKLTSSKIKELNIYEGLLTPSFNKDVTAYSVLVPNEITSLDLGIILEDEDATYIVNDNGDFIVGGNIVEIIVTDSLGLTSTTYTINVTRQISSNNFLLSLNSDIGILNPVFDKYKMSYDIYVLNDVTHITLTGETEDSSATVTGFETHQLNTGLNIIPITVTSQSGVTRTYFVNINRALSDDNLLSDLSIIGGELSPSFDPTTHEYTVTVPSGINNITINATASGNIIGNGTLEITNQEIIHQVTVTSESGLTNTYTLHIKKMISDDA